MTRMVALTSNEEEDEERTTLRHSEIKMSGNINKAEYKEHSPCRLPDQAKNNNLSGYSNVEFLNSNAKLIGIKGYWYDITKFVPHHPGGDIIEHFIGCDATTVFNAFHEKDVLKYRKPVGVYCRKKESATEAFERLRQYFLEAGFFVTSYKWYAVKMAITFSILFLSVYLITHCREPYLHYLGAGLLSVFWQQCGFFMHDFMHSQGTHNRKVDSLLGTFFGTVCTGICGSWWQDEHFTHHAFPNTVDYETGFYDPQMVETVWAQNEKLFPFFQTYLHSLAIKIQHISFIPLCLLSGRICILFDSFKQEKRPIELAAGVINWICVIMLFTYLPSRSEMIICALISNCCFGILIIQLLISHYAKPFFYKKEICNTQNWYLLQIECNINIVNPVWLDWFHGGLNFHIEHHLYPMMPRHNYREASKHVQRVCRELGIAYDECTLTQAVCRTLKNFKTTSKHFKLDPR